MVVREGPAAGGGVVGRLDELSAAKNSDDTRSSHWSDDGSDDEKRGGFDRIMWSESKQ